MHMVGNIMCREEEEEEEEEMVYSNTEEETDESGLELGLSLGFSSLQNSKTSNKSVFFNFTAQSLPSSNSSSHFTKASSNQVVGWPPIRAYRMNSVVNQVKYPSSDELQPNVEKRKNKNDDIDMNNCEEGKSCNVKEQGQIKKSNFVKVNKDGNGIGRKVDLGAHRCYETLAQIMEGMFEVCPTKRSSVNEHDMIVEATRSSKLLDGSSEFLLTYEDKDGDWMLVGDVPWGMFINSVKRLRIMRTAEANGLGSKFQVRNVRQSLPV